MIYVILSTRHPIFSRSPHFHVRPLPGIMALATGRADKACRSAGAAARPAGDVGCSCIRQAEAATPQAGAAEQERPCNVARTTTKGRNARRNLRTETGRRKRENKKNRLQERPYPANISYMKMAA